MKSLGRRFIGIVAIYSFTFSSCEKKGAVEKSASVENKLTGSALNSQLRGDERSSIEELTQKIVQYDIRDGFTDDYVKTAQKLIERDPKLALKTLYNSNTIGTLVAFDDVCKKLAGSDPDLLIGWLRNDLPSLTSDGTIAGLCWWNALKALVVVDPDKALSAIKSSNLKQNENRLAVAGMFHTLSKSDHGRALNMVQQLPTGLRDSAYEGIGQSLAADEPAKAFQISMLMGKDSNERARLSDYIFSEWLKSNPEEASKEIAKLDFRQFEKIGLLGDNQENGFIKTLAETKPELLQNFLLQITPGIGNKKLFETSIMALAHSNFEAAFKTVNDLPIGELRNELTEVTFATGVDYGNALKYLRMAESLEGDAKLSAIDGISRSFSNNTLDEIVAVAANIDESNKSRFLLAALTSSGSQRLEEMMGKIAAQEFNDKLNSDDLKTLTHDFATTLAINNTDRAVSWYEQLPQGQRVAAMEGIASGMASRDINRLGDWLNSKKQDEEWAAGVSVIVKHLDYTDSQAAAVWKKALTDFSARQKP